MRGERSNSSHLENVSGGNTVSGKWVAGQSDVVLGFIYTVVAGKARGEAPASVSSVSRLALVLL